MAMHKLNKKIYFLTRIKQTQWSEPSPKSPDKECLFLFNRKSESQGNLFIDRLQIIVYNLYNIV